MTGPSRGSIEVKDTSSLQDPIENGSSQVLVVKYLAPLIE